MDDFFGLGFLFGMLLATLVLGSVFIGWHQYGREACAVKNNVYDCEYVGQWQPKRLSSAEPQQ